jgi:hypothetical protein
MRPEGLNKMKIDFYKCALDFKLAAIIGSALSIFSKKSKSMHSTAQMHMVVCGSVTYL